jgi:hypothetical protein
MVTICLVIVLFICKRYTNSEGKFSCIWNLYFSHSELNKDQNFELAFFFFSFFFYKYVVFAFILLVCRTCYSLLLLLIMVYTR